MTARPVTMPSAASDSSQFPQLSSDVPRASMARTVAISAPKPNRLPTSPAATRSAGVVSGLVRKVIPAATGILARTGSEKIAAPMICTPGIRNRTPTNRPTATPRGTERRVKRHNSSRRKWVRNGREKRCPAICSRLGMLRVNQAPKRSGSAMLAHQPALLPLPVLLLLMLALVVRLAAAGKGELDFGPAARIEIDGERNERHALARDRAEHLADLPLVEEQLARPFRLVIMAVAVAELGDVGVDQPDFAVLHLGIAFGDRSLAE